MYTIGLDIGTTGTKAVLVESTTGTISGKGYRGYSLIKQGECVEQNVNDWISASVASIREAMRGNEELEVSGIAVSSQGASMAIVDKDGFALGNAITWMDTRASVEARELESLLGNDYIYHMCGWRMFPTLDAAKILYLKRAGYERPGCRYLSTIEIINLFLTGNAVIDPTNAAIRQIMDIRTANWDVRMLEAIGITSGQLPDIYPTGELIGGLSKEASHALGLKCGIPVFNGAHDQYCASIGSGAIHNGDMLLSAGTTWVLLGLGLKLLFTESFISPSIHPVPGLYGAMASLAGSGVSMEWYKNQFLPDDTFFNVDMEAQKRDIGDLFYYPYPLGAAYPLWNTRARAAFTGSSLKHDRYDYARAIMEGVTFGVQRALCDFKQNGFEICSLKVIGGAAKSPLWTQLICDITNKNVELLCESDACALGAAIIAACGAGAHTDYLSAVNAMVHSLCILSPDVEQTSYYIEKHKRYKQLWENIAAYYQ